MENRIDFFDFVAILGALAWIPPIIIWIKNSFLKPKIKILNGNELEIGFNTLGPIMNLQLAFLSDNMKALIERIEIELTHENNDTQKFTWEWLEETLYETNVPNTGSMPTKKNQKAIAINLKKEELTEKKIGFQQNTFKAEHYRLLTNMIEEALNFEKTGKARSELLSTKNFNDLSDYYKHSFNWKIGRYKILIKVKVANVNEPFKKQLFFKITPLELNNLEGNIDMCKDVIKRIFIEPDDQSVNWRWVNPVLEDLN